MNNENGYVCFYSGKCIEVYAPTLYAAKLKALAEFKVRKKQEYLVHCHLAELHGDAVTHTAID